MFLQALWNWNEKTATTVICSIQLWIQNHCTHVDRENTYLVLLGYRTLGKANAVKRSNNHFQVNNTFGVLSFRIIGYRCCVVVYEHEMKRTVERKSSLNLLDLIRERKYIIASSLSIPLLLKVTIIECDSAI